MSCAISSWKKDTNDIVYPVYNSLYKSLTSPPPPTCPNSRKDKKQKIVWGVGAA
nr:MAG TPA: hypothetical protein [Caudoviricetes sp.]